MKDQNLKKLLVSVTPPVVNETARERALHRATVALAQPADPAQSAQAPAWWRGSQGWLAACAVLLVAGLVMINPFGSAPAKTGGVDAGTLAQVEALFPGQLNAVIERDGEVRIDLSSQSLAAGIEQPVLVELERGGHRLRVLSYSGRSITLELKGTRFTFEALVTSNGGVVLSGDNFAWSSDQPKPFAGYRVQAQPLYRTL